MNKRIICALNLVVSLMAGAQETFTAYVRNDCNEPVTNAIVTLKTMNKLILFGSDRAGNFDTYKAVTDTNGCATIRFRCLNGAFSWWVSAPNCYDHESETVEFKLKEYNTLHPVLLEHDVVRDVVLRRKIAPRPMYLRGAYPRVKMIHESGVFGFDLKIFDWVSPYGKGEVPDFCVRQSYCDDDQECSISGTLLFAEGCGGYVCKKSENKSFVSAYYAETNRVFAREFKFEEGWSKVGKSLLRKQPILKGDEYMVLRTRVVKDEKGNVVEANYSEILGPFAITFNGVEMRLSIFNPDVNDANLEYDWNRNLMTKRR